MQTGGCRVTAATRNRHAAGFVIRRLSKPSAESLRMTTASPGVQSHADHPDRSELRPDLACHSCDGCATALSHGRVGTHVGMGSKISFDVKAKPARSAAVTGSRLGWH